MKSLIKGFIIAAAMLSFAVIANAEEGEYYQKSDNISFNYGDNTFSVTDNTQKTDETELTIMLVKGDYTEASLASVTATDICYIGQASGVSYSDLFNNLGVKYTGGKFEPGVYTLVTSGYGEQSAAKQRIFLGNAVTADAAVSEYMHSTFSGKKVDFGTMSQTIKVYEKADPEHYIYVGVGRFPLEGTVTRENLGFAVQKMVDGESVDKGYRSLDSFANISDSLKNIVSFAGGSIEVGIQINGLAKTTEIVAIPYVLTSASEVAE